MMKKLFILMMLLVTSLSLAACNVETDDPDETLYTLTIESVVNIETTITPEGPYTSNEEVAVTLDTYADGYTFTGWHDNDALLSSDETYTFNITEDTTLKAVFESVSEDNGTDDNDTDGNGTDDNGTDDNGTDDNGTDDNGTDDNDTDDNDAELNPVLYYYTGFEDAVKNAYADDNVMLSDEQWYFSDALIGNLENDQLVDNFSVRIRQGYIETEFAVSDVYGVSFLYGQYLSDEPSDITFYVSTDGDAWTQLGDAYTATDSFEQFEIIFDEALYNDHDFTSTDGLYFRIDASTTSERVNIDEFEIYTASGEGLPDDSEEDPNGDPDDGDEPTDDTGEGEEEQDLLDMKLDPYYESVEGLYGQELIDGLRSLMWENLVYETYGESRYILAVSDQDPNNPDNVIQIYTRNSVIGDWEDGGTGWSGNWNREHVWPQSALTEPTSGNTSTGQGSDLHNLAPADPNENQLRGNRYFDNIGTGDSYTPHDDAKGMVARMLLYMDIMYTDLTLVSGAANIDNYEMGDLDYLLAWNDTFAPDDFEINRNNVIESYQNNRNPFVDYPHFAELIWYDNPYFQD